MTENISINIDTHNFRMAVGEITRAGLAGNQDVSVAVLSVAMSTSRSHRGGLLEVLAVGVGVVVDLSTAIALDYSSRGGRDGECQADDGDGVHFVCLARVGIGD